MAPSVEPHHPRRDFWGLPRSRHPTTVVPRLQRLLPADSPFRHPMGASDCHCARRWTLLVPVAELAAESDWDFKYAIVNEAGASIYSASPLAREEFPDLDATARSI